MRLIKMFGLAAIAAVAAMAFVGATSASATSTQLCNSHAALTCSSAATSAHQVLATGTVGKLLSSLSTILCLTVLVSGIPKGPLGVTGELATGGPQTIPGTNVFEGCGTNSTHTNCEVEIEVQPGGSLLKTGLDEGSLTATSGQSHVVCDNIGGFIDIDCKYSLTGLLFSVGAQHLTANKTPVNEVGDKALCPNSPTLDGLLKNLTDQYLLG